MAHKVLFVDDDPNLLAGLQRTLRKQLNLETAFGPEEGLARLQQCGPYAVAVVDMRMPGMSGVELLRKAQEIAPDTVRIMLTGNADQKTAIDAVNEGRVFQFLTKPCSTEELLAAVEAGIRRYDVRLVERELLEGTLAGLVGVLNDVLAAVDSDGFGRGQRLRESMRAFAHWLRLDGAWECEIGATLARIGASTLPLATLRRWQTGAVLTPAETAAVERVPEIGARLLGRIPRLEAVARIVLYQNKHYNGTGFPRDEVAGEALPIGARMLRILADRQALEEEGVSKAAALAALRERAGWYDPRLLEQCFACFPDFLRNPIGAGLPVHSVDVGQLAAGEILVSDVKTTRGLVLAHSGSCLTPMMLDRLGNFLALGELTGPILVQRPAAATAA